MANHTTAPDGAHGSVSSPDLRGLVSPNGGPPPPAREIRKLNILVGDREGIFRLGLTRLLAAEDDLTLAAEVDQSSDLVSQVAGLQPDVMFVQHEMLRPDPQAALGAIREAAPSTLVVVTASTIAEDESVALMKGGARGVILKTADPALFIKCARKIAEGEIWLPKKQVAQMARVLSEPQSRPVDTLTNREKLVISCLVQGWRNREIAHHLTITEQTVKNHLRSIFDKVGVSDRVELVLYAIHQRLDLPPVAAGARSA